MKPFCLGLVLMLALSSCFPPSTEPNVYRKFGFYPQDFKTPVAALVKERNGQPFYLASAFLVDRESGSFATAKHFIDQIGESGFMIFFNGHVYNGQVAVVPVVSDLALVGIGGVRDFTGSSVFNPADFPEPFFLSESRLKVGETVKMMGAHPHPSQWQTGKHLLGIFKDYYNLSLERNEFVFDELAGKISSLAVEVKNKDISGTVKEAGFISNTYIEVITDEDHLFSFGGLSGGPAVGQDGKVVGILSHGQEGGYFQEGPILVYRPWNTLRIVPVKELRKMLK